MRIGRHFIIAILAFFLSVAATAQTRVLRGLITDGEEPLAGAGILQSGTKNGTMADSEGKFSLKIPSGKKVSITVSYIGMEAQTLTIGENQNDIEVVLKSDTNLDAAVINAGYGVIQRKENLTGSAYEVKGEDLRLRPSARLDDLLIGQVPGMNVIEDDSGGSSRIKIRIRGDGSLSASCEPLWIIDGVPIYTGNKSNTITGSNFSISPLSYINPDDIESMTVLKDASTTALYGADG